MNRLVCIACLAAFSTASHATVFINEVFLNPPGSTDNVREYIELLGTPNMKLDGYAIALANGAQRKEHPETPIPPTCADDPNIIVCVQEIDEFFSLDGLSLGANGILLLARGGASFYPTRLVDTTFREWDNPNIWNGGLDTPGGFENDGSNTLLLLRNRPGRTQADPANPAGLRWGKDIDHDREVIALGGGLIQFGDGNFDKADPDGLGGFTLDLKGSSTPEDLLDDLEIVDEVSYEHDAGWEYDQDDRNVDVGSTHPGLPPRNVHALDDPQGINPDTLTRVDYRTKGLGWPPAPGGVGELPNGNNWQDTATEQWIRGEAVQCVSGCSGQGPVPQFYYDNLANDNPDAIQPYSTQVPLWLSDAEAPNYDFSTSFTYQIMPGRINPLSTPFIPGDTDRDGDCDAEDIAKIAAVFGDDDWIFSNSYQDAPEGDDGDPALQTRPWDVDLTGDNGIEPNDLQWVLNFQGSTNGRIVGVQYDSTTPTAAGQGVHLNANAGVTCAVTATAVSASGRPLNALKLGDRVYLTISAELTAGANLTANQENGVMQFVQDLLIDTGGVLRVLEDAPQAPFTRTRAFESLLGTAGDGGMANLNGHTTSFAQGLGGPAALTRISLVAAGLGSANVRVTPATYDKFAASAPDGLKVGHTNGNGNPVSVVYPSSISLSVTNTVRPDFDQDGDVDNVPGGDLDHFLGCANGPEIPQNESSCQNAKLDGDDDVDQADFSIFQRCYSGPTGSPSQDCDVP